MGIQHYMVGNAHPTVLMVGYRSLKYDYLVEDDESVIRINFNGPFIGLNVPF